MTVKIEKQYPHKIYILCFIFSLLIHCEVKAMKTDDAAKDTVTLILGFELCEPKGIRQFSMCNDGFEQAYDIASFIRWEKRKGVAFFLNDYYTFESGRGDFYDSALEKTEEIAKLVQANQIVSIYGGRKFKNTINKRVKRMRAIGMYGDFFDGNFYYALFKVTLVRRYLGMKNKILPNFKSSNSNIIITDTLVNMYYIEKIIEIEPITNPDPNLGNG